MYYSRKSKSPYFIILFIFIALVSCSSDDDNEDFNDEIFLSATINGINYHMNCESAIINARRFVDPTGLLRLEVQAVAQNGESVRFQIPDYNGPNGYVIGENPMLPSLIVYEKLSPFGQWECNNPGPNELEQNFIEILADDGKMIDGNFQFTGLNKNDSSLQSVTDGRFRLKIE
ncbi:hypothetical protein MKO06_07335 [Gramella sp. GC03-9]|uniref:Lipoprotein n=1 Tax=Christiangramia oceanisediminis TaxID=2920386 RepID=A0A9X2KXG2_9FLAO|nr:hypothetical protein [Gramella oceanisediminis]MCP9199711.1 hypothetical protein [Gramella oceanisediminis]